MSSVAASAYAYASRRRTSDLEAKEPLLCAEQRLTVYPLVHMDIWQHYKRQLASFWTPEEVDFSKDREHWLHRLTDDERHFIKSVLAFFAGSDTVVSLNLMQNFCQEVKVIEAQIVYTYQAMMENVHAEVYSLMIDTYIQDAAEKARMFEELGGMASVTLKVEWAKRWAGAARPFAHRLVAFAIVEGVFFSGAFCAIYWIKQRGLLPGLTKSNEFIARDEGQHTDFACLLYSRMTATRMSQEEAHAMFRDAVAVEKEFILESIPCRMVGMNSELMAQYIEYVADGVLAKLGYPALYGTANPFGFMDLIGMGGRSKFFEERVSLYQRADVLNTDGGGAGGAGSKGLLYTDDF
jgi:ribonucleotide reductase beta subunit family protein with ferritin-like domain